MVELLFPCHGRAPPCTSPPWWLPTSTSPSFSLAEGTLELVAPHARACSLSVPISQAAATCPYVSPRSCSLGVIVKISLLCLAPSTLVGRSIKFLNQPACFE
uniref:Uncharacterized protein n=1 Tax=Zea mays TaxID=4577 RepID=A0A804PCB2_MAIZE